MLLAPSASPFENIRCICAKTIHPCIVLATSFGKAETSLLIKPAASVPLLNILDVSERTGTGVVPRNSEFRTGLPVPGLEQPEFCII